jgi:formamidopyrimidine-DNA glycosylase
MPELAEVEYYRRQWDAGLGARIVRIEWHAKKRLFHGIAPHTFTTAVTGARYAGSEARAKQMLFWFTRGRGKQPHAWVGIHLGMTGSLRTERREFALGVHDHLALFTARVALVLKDPRMFGRVRFHTGAEPPEWWTQLPPAVDSDEFSFERMHAFLQRRARLAVKAALLVQEMFPGVGNWMADEILWHARIDPRTLCGQLTKTRARVLWREARKVCRVAMETVGVDFSEPPASWFFHVRWTAAGRCPRCKGALLTATIGGRTTRWCGRCQR